MALPPRKPDKRSKEERRDHERNSDAGKLLRDAGFGDPVNCSAELWQLAQYVAGPIDPDDSDGVDDADEGGGGNNQDPLAQQPGQDESDAAQQQQQDQQ